MNSMMNRKRVFALSVGFTLFLGFAASSTSQSIQGKEDLNVPAVPEVLKESEVLEALGVPDASRDTNVEPLPSEIAESSVCTCEQVGKQGEQVKRAKGNDLIEENLVIEKKSGKSFDVITITIPNGDKKQRSPLDTLEIDPAEPEAIALDDSIEENIKEEDVVKAKPDEKLSTTTVEEESEVDKDTNVNKKTKEEKVKGDKKSSKYDEKKRIKRTTYKGGKRYGKKGKGKSKGKKR